ncbi:diaminopimelate epimerase [bacterium]|nr:diaminopimelate epimerase [bacterium]
MKITKMHGCGNDFVFMDYDEFQKTKMSLESLSSKVCDRHFGIGADGLIIPFPYDGEDADLAWEYYNSDGTPAQMCGNGMRCFARYVYDKGLVNKKSFAVKTRAGIIKPQIIENELIKVNMGAPILEDERIPFKGERKIDNFVINPISMGNPHCVIFTDENTMNMAQTYGPKLEKHQYFPEKTNVEFVKIISESEIEMSVYERGCGITLACGTGACASVVACVLNNLTENIVKVNLPGGVVNVEWQGSSDNRNENVYLIGPAQYSFNAEYML